MLSDWSVWFRRVAGDVGGDVLLVLVGLVLVALLFLAAWAFTVLVTLGLRQRHRRVCDEDCFQLREEARRPPRAEEGPP